MTRRVIMRLTPGVSFPYSKLGNPVLIHEEIMTNREFDFDLEVDSCGTGFVCDIKGRRSHDVLRDALHAVARIEHRGAVHPDGRTSDGAGVLTHIPWDLLWNELELSGDTNDHALAMVFVRESQKAEGIAIVEAACRAAELAPVVWRDVPFLREELGSSQIDRAPNVYQLVVRRSGLDDTAFDQALLIARRMAEKLARQASLSDFSLPSLSRNTVVYKALVVPSALPMLYPDLVNPAFVTAVALFHQRYSTNTVTSWHLAQPLRMLAHNGEINTLLGNVNRLTGREAQLCADGWLSSEGLRPLVAPGGSDSMALDNTLEILCAAGRNPVHSMAMLVPDAYEGKDLPKPVHDFYRYHASLMEPWDGPAALVFTNGRTVGAALDRNGLRPLRYWITDDRVIVASEAGVVDVPDDEIRVKGRLGPGKMISVNTATGRVFFDEDIKSELAQMGPWTEWLDRNARRFEAVGVASVPSENLVDRQKCFGWGREHVEKVLEPMAFEGREPIGSMGDDTPLAVLSEKPQRLARFFRQRFAQVTNPPIDPLREQLVMSLTSRIGAPGSLLDQQPVHDDPLIEFPSPLIGAGELAAIQKLPSFPCVTLDTTFAVEDGPEGFRLALAELQRKANEVVKDGCRLILLSDRAVSAERAPLPAPLVTGAVHHALVAPGTRMSTSLVYDTGDSLEDHDVAVMLGFGALLVHPRLALESVAGLAEARGEDALAAERRYMGVIEKGLRKILAKLGISTLSSYRGSQSFEALGISSEVIDAYFTGTPTRIGGVSLQDIAEHTLEFHAEAFGEDTRLKERGIYRFRRDGEYHAFNPSVFKPLHKAVREQDPVAFEEYRTAVDDRPPTALRDLLTWKLAEKPLDLSEVESADAIVTRFCTQAMSFGAISREAHEVLAVAMNRIGGKSNSGEGGEEAERLEVYDHDARERSLAAWYPHKGDLGNSAIKQVASGRFGVTPWYLASASELEIKMAQGSKPGEGGQIPGFKITEAIAKTRRSQPGITLISPPPHHDIYSIEDLAQLIYDLKHVNPRATICVKLVSGTGVGTVAAGVVKAYADTVQISGHDGGTGASPLSSIKHAGLPWEVGLADAQHTLMNNGLRGRVKLRVDGGLKTGRDVVIAALLGAEEFGFGTAPLVAAGCVMARQCHANTCPVGVATQREDLRAKFPGTPENVISFMYFVAEHVRLVLAEMGIRSLQEIIGNTELLEPRAGLPRRALSVDLALLLKTPGVGPRSQSVPRNDRPEPVPLDVRLVATFADAVRTGTAVDQNFLIDNRDRSVGTGLAGLIASYTGETGLPEDTLRLRFQGQAGQSFGAFCHKGMHLELVGEAQDYVGKGMAGGMISIRPMTYDRQDVLMGNTVAYGATGGSLFVAGMAGERLGVRNSGATIVVEGCGDHGCEYMTGGTVLVLGPVGNNFAAGMSGGRAIVFDPTDAFPLHVNPSMAAARRADPVDMIEVEQILKSHLEATGSPRAVDLLRDLKADEFWVVSAAGH